jgi:hypothetical protein
MTKNAAIKLAIKSMERVCHENYTHSASAARYGFQFGINAKKKYDEIHEAIKILEGLKEA